MSSLTTIATDLIHTLGLGGVGVGLALNCIGIPIPSEIVIPLSGIAIRQGQYNAFVVFIVIVVAQLGGLCISYAIGRFGGLELIQRYGKYVFLSKHELNRAQKAFHRHGVKLVLVGLCLPGLHGYVGYPAGIAKMPMWRFLIAASAGVAVWSLAFLGIGYFLGDHLDAIDNASHNFAIIVFVVVVIAVISYLIQRNRKAHLEDSTINPA